MIYLDTESTNPYFNFAVEEYFTSVAPLKETLFLFWRTEPTVMLGNYQNPYQELNISAIERDNIHVVRRVTGGGTIYTDLGGWQFSFIEKGTKETISFEHYMDPIVEILSNIGVKVEYNSRNDLILEGKKISGNAQCVKNGYTLHHGSLLYETDLSLMMNYLNIPDYKIKSKGIQSVKDRTTNIKEHMEGKLTSEKFQQAFIQYAITGGMSSRKLSEIEKKAIEKIAREKFQSWEWNFGKAPEFTIEKSQVYAGGKLTVQLNVVKGIIQQCSIYGDFFSATGTKKLEKALENLPYRKEEVAREVLNGRYQHTIHLITPEEIVNCIFENKE